MTVRELITVLSQIDNLDELVHLGSDGAPCRGIDEGAEGDGVYINFSWKD